jgi:hypothetical protein
LVLEFAAVTALHRDDFSKGSLAFPSKANPAKSLLLEGEIQT